MVKVVCTVCEFVQMYANEKMLENYECTDCGNTGYRKWKNSGTNNNSKENSLTTEEESIEMKEDKVITTTELETEASSRFSEPDLVSEMVELSKKFEDSEYDLDEVNCSGSFSGTHNFNLTITKRERTTFCTDED